MLCCCGQCLHGGIHSLTVPGLSRLCGSHFHQPVGGRRDGHRGQWVCRFVHVLRIRLLQIVVEPAHLGSKYSQLRFKVTKRSL